MKLVNSWAASRRLWFAHAPARLMLPGAVVRVSRSGSDIGVALRIHRFERWCGLILLEPVDTGAEAALNITDAQGRRVDVLDAGFVSPLEDGHLRDRNLWTPSHPWFEGASMSDATAAEPRSGSGAHGAMSHAALAPGAATALPTRRIHPPLTLQELEDGLRYMELASITRTGADRDWVRDAWMFWWFDVHTKVSLFTGPRQGLLHWPFECLTHEDLVERKRHIELTMGIINPTVVGVLGRMHQRRLAYAARTPGQTVRELRDAIARRAQVHTIPLLEVQYLMYTIFSGWYPGFDVPGSDGGRAFARSVGRFATGRLGAHTVPHESCLNNGAGLNFSEGNPDSANFIYFTEFALACMAHEPDMQRRAWAGVLPALVAATHGFFTAYGEPDGAIPEEEYRSRVRSYPRRDVTDADIQRWYAECCNKSEDQLEEEFTQLVLEHIHGPGTEGPSISVRSINPRAGEAAPSSIDPPR